MAAQKNRRDWLLRDLRSVQTLCELLLIVGRAIAVRKMIAKVEATRALQFDTQVGSRIGSRIRREHTAEALRAQS